MSKRYSPKQRREYTDANREAWDQVAPVLGFNISEFCVDLEHAEARPPMGMTMVWQRR